ncbi:putative protein FAM221B like [Monocercomonoides exilis]|uniref:putative protein FAM221B like n=1 Tax=Monocercomonoides exilis TaxID=2049356 RepID=UPI00355AAE1E|nr:putative protein FAM221B like [Monocercomonoides exilis]|eukprot:MONOS_16093.1-p1 / transcript=MONOS_16093.1 / gene=MONOS_16093 / organism=Monocercomonoides_exilis_PA203 / gene_product=SJCHGC05018 protein / transcript_product=SJCHGC05018 protein / location=Mono_scaffold01501:1860-3161(+) / protein_length=332 / sequence_SO=supercontig / SO=protein_coding / is_pseudo=false
MSFPKKMVPKPKVGISRGHLAVVHSSSKKATSRGQPVIISNMRAPGSIGIREAVEQYGPAPGARFLMDREMEAAEWSIKTGIYGIWRCEKAVQRAKDEAERERRFSERSAPSIFSSDSLKAETSHHQSFSSRMDGPTQITSSTPFPKPSSAITPRDVHSSFKSDSEFSLDYPSADSVHFLDFCARIGPSCRCFCGHKMDEHEINPLDKRRPTTRCKNCTCRRFEFVPMRPEEVGDWHLPRRKDFNVLEWRPKCKCNHTHEQHSPDPSHHCKICGCGSFQPHYCCVTCQMMGSEHETVWESREERIEMGFKVDEDYKPLSSTPDISEVVFKKK